MMHSQKCHKLKKLRMQFKKEVKHYKKNIYWIKFENCNGDSVQTYKLRDDISGKSSKSNLIPILQSYFSFCPGNLPDADIAEKTLYFLQPRAEHTKKTSIETTNDVNVSFLMKNNETNTVKI